MVRSIHLNKNIHQFTFLSCLVLDHKEKVTMEDLTPSPVYQKKTTRTISQEKKIPSNHLTAPRTLAWIKKADVDYKDGKKKLTTRHQRQIKRALHWEGVRKEWHFKAERKVERENKKKWKMTWSKY